MIRRSPIACLAGLAVPAWAANKDIERLQIQIAGPAGADRRPAARVAEDSRRRSSGSTSRWPSRTRSSRRRCRTAACRTRRSQAALKDIHRSRVSELERARCTGAGARGAPRRPCRAPAGRATAPGPARRPSPGAARPRRRRRPPPRASSTARPTPTTRAATTTSRSRSYRRVPAQLSRHRLLGQRAVLDRRVPVRRSRRYAEAIEAWDDAAARLPVERQAARTPATRRAWPSSGSAARSQALVEYRCVVDRYPNSEAGPQGAREAQPLTRPRRLAPAAGA